MEDKVKFGQFIAQKRKENQLTQRELAERLYVTESAVSKWERGLSYPDISLVTAICETLQITEHELITASVDYEQKQFEKQARKYRMLYILYNSIILGTLGIALLICLTVDFFVDYQLSWSFIVLAAELTAASVLIVPVLAPSHKGVWTICSSLFAISMLLLVICFFQPGIWIVVALLSIDTGYTILFLPFLLREWMKPVGIGKHKALLCMLADTSMIFALIIVCCRCAGVPVSVINQIPIPICFVGMVLPWMLFLILRYVRLNCYLKTAACLLAGAVYMQVANGLIEEMINQTGFHLQPVNLFCWNRAYCNGNLMLLLTIFAACLAVLFFVIGLRKKT